MNAPFSIQPAERFEAGRLWSLSEVMEPFEAGRLVESVHHLVGQAYLGTDDKAPLTSNVRILGKQYLDALLEECEKLGLLVASHYAREAIQLIGVGPLQGETGMFSRMANTIAHTIRIEMEARKFFSLSPEKQRFYEPKEPLFGRDFDVKFPSASFELDEAGKCLALARTTAGVFHLMRLLEIGLSSVANCLAIPPATTGGNRNWGAILISIKNEIERRNKAKAWASPKDAQLFAEAHASLDAVRVAWRNATMHVENKYTEDEAEHIFIAMRGFMTKLASRHDEQGLPKA